MYQKDAIPHGLSKVQVLANKDEISELLKKGWTYINIYKELSSNNKITMKYGAFAYHLRKIFPEFIKRKRKGKNNNPLPHSPNKPDTTVKKDNKSFETENKSLDDFV